jgi:ferredoxin
VDLLSVTERIADLQAPDVALNAARCLHTTDRFSTCQACLGACPLGAIAFEEAPPAPHPLRLHAAPTTAGVRFVQPGQTSAADPPSVQYIPKSVAAAACQSCLACLPACPTGAYTGPDAVPDVLNCAARLEAETLEVLCQRHPRPQTGLASAAAIRMRGCLAGLGAGGLAALAALGVGRIVLRADACAGCDWGGLRPRIQDSAAQARMLLGAWVAAATGAAGQRLANGNGAAAQAGPPAVIEIWPALPEAAERPWHEADNPPLSRRDLFRLASRRGAVLAARAINDDAPAARAPSRDRLRAVKAMAVLGGGAQAPAAPAQGAPAPAYPHTALITVSDACTACGVCARACPTGALRFERTGAPAYRLSFQAWACIGCGACQRVCAPAAIGIDHAPPLLAVFGGSQPQVLSEGGLARCGRCKAWIRAERSSAGEQSTAGAPGPALCALCDLRRKNPFGALPLPGLGRPQP